MKKGETWFAMSGTGRRQRLHWPEMGKKTFPSRLTATGVLGGVA